MYKINLRDKIKLYYFNTYADFESSYYYNIEKIISIKIGQGHRHLAIYRIFYREMKTQCI
jgi:hypothetical protein